MGVPIAALPGFVGSGLDQVFSSLPWWDGEEDWYWREDAALRAIAPVIAPMEAPFAARLGAHLTDPARRVALLRRQMALAALLGSGWMMTMGGEYAALRRLDARRDTPASFEMLRATMAEDLGPLAAGLNRARAAPPLSGAAAPRLLTGPGAPVLVVGRALAADPRLPGPAAVIELNLTGAEAVVDQAAAFAGLGGSYDLPPPAVERLAPGGWRVTGLAWRDPEIPGTADLPRGAAAAAALPRIALENLTPCVDGGHFPARFCVGETVTVEADLICDGHDMLAAALAWRAPGGVWQETRMRPLGNDRWTAAFPLLVLGVHQYRVEAWKDSFASFRDELRKKVAAGLQVTLEAEEGRLLIAAAKDARLAAVAADLAGGPIAQRVALLLSDETAALMEGADRRPHLSVSAPACPVEAERTAARFASWYELFPRSMSGDPSRHGTFADVIAQLPRIAAMGFDVLYFPPIHPIGVKNRKGGNNALVATGDDPGSPYGIADHTALHPQLGSFADFARLRDAALAHGMELALDFAIQCSPDHVWLKEHPGWFDWRPDGSIRYAENPPKKYQDIVNVDFYKAASVPDLWAALCAAVLFWCGQGVRIFRVDNPHTKPLPFWHWMIGEVRARHPDTLFLAEAFTRPKVMNRLAKIGFSQSYTYFTWRQSKAELTEYMTELTTTEAREFFRPNFFVNTPDINPVFLQRAGRPGHLIRAALATMLAGLWGMYSGFELCEAAPLPGREEYQDSEKYQLRAWDWERPGNIAREITQLNWMRRTNPALRRHLGLTFLTAWNDNVLYFEKATANRDNVVLVAINLDPYAVREADFELPLWRWGLGDDATLRGDDLVTETRFSWTGKIQHVRLDPARNPYAIWRVQPA